MSNFRFWATLITAFILGLIGLLLGNAVPLPAPFDGASTRITYALLGILVAFLTFARVSGWVVSTTSRLLRQAVTRLAFEIINQFSRAASRGIRLALPVAGEMGSGNGLDVRRLGGSGAVILDTSSIIDGRILDVAKTGFLSGFVLVPEFVLSELRLVADSADSQKRSRGRRGFEVVDQLKKVSGLKLEVWDKELAGKGVDEKLIRLGKILHARVLTCDFNLAQEAKAHGVRTLNLNDLTNALKTLPVPGERLGLRIIHPGKDRDQGVGYCSDGTMVVVKDGVSLVGQDTSIEVTKILQGPSGRMIFGRISD